MGLVILEPPTFTDVEVLDHWVRSTAKLIFD
jgi:hypothetical protein